jgi:hypothetical protein
VPPSSKPMTPPTPPALLPENRPPCAHCGGPLAMFCFATEEPDVTNFGCKTCGRHAYEVLNVWSVMEAKP